MNTSYVSKFLQYLRYEKRYSPLTNLAYEKNLKDFFTYLLSTYTIEDPKQIKHIHIRSWLASLKEVKQTATTINRKQSVLRSFFKYALGHYAHQSAYLTSLKMRKQALYLKKLALEKDSRALPNDLSLNYCIKRVCVEQNYWL